MEMPQFVRVLVLSGNGLGNLIIPQMPGKAKNILKGFTNQWTQTVVYKLKQWTIHF